MKRAMWYSAICMLLVVFIFPSSANSAEPMEMIKNTTERIIKIVSDPKLKGKSMTDKRRALIRGAVNEIFDWEEFSKRSLGRHWRKRTPEEKKEFISLYSRLLEKTYIDKVEGYSGEEVHYLYEKIEGRYAKVKVEVITEKGQKIPVQYRFIKKDGKWRVYDLIIEGVSLTNNYRAQFNNILVRSSFKTLLKKLKKKVSK